MGNGDCAIFAKNPHFIGKMKDLGVRRLKSRIHDLNLCIQILNIWIHIFNLRVQRLNLRKQKLNL